MIKILNALAVLFILCACVPKIEFSAHDITKQKKQNNTHGIVVLRPMFFDTEPGVKLFSLSEKYMLNGYKYKLAYNITSKQLEPDDIAFALNSDNHTLRLITFYNEELIEKGEIPKELYNKILKSLQNHEKNIEFSSIDKSYLLRLASMKTAILKLDHTNSAYASAKNFDEKKEKSLNILYPVGGGSYKQDEVSKKRFEMTPMINSWSIFEPATFKPGYFYYVTSIPEGKYYISSLSSDIIMGRAYGTTYDKSNSPFYFEIKAGHINYIGDLYLVSPKECEGFWSPQCKIKIVITDKADLAYDFIREFYPEIKLPLIKNTIKTRETRK